MADGRCLDMSDNATQQRAEPVGCECRWGVYWRHLANTSEPSMCGGDAAFR